MNLSRLRLITFDVTDTLLKFRNLPGKQYGEIGAMYGVLADNNSLAANFKAHWYKMNKEHPNFGLKSGLGWENWWKMVVSGTFKDAKYNVEDSKLDAIASHLLEVYKTSACWQQCFGASDLLSNLRSKDVPLGIYICICTTHADCHVHLFIEYTIIINIYAGIHLCLYKHTQNG